MSRGFDRRPPEKIGQGGFSISLAMGVVTLTIDCGDGYAASVLFDDLAARLTRGEPVTLRTLDAPPAQDRR